MTKKLWTRRTMVKSTVAAIAAPYVITSTALGTQKPRRQARDPSLRSPMTITQTKGQILEVGD